MNDEDQEFLESLRCDFVIEASEMLAKCEESLLNYEVEFNISFYQEYMRFIHSMKGSARAVEFNTFASTIHNIESIGQKSKDQQFVELSLKLIDEMKEVVNLMKSRDYEQMELKLTSICGQIK